MNGIDGLTNTQQQTTLLSRPPNKNYDSSLHHDEA
jgi:hypothetical protein